MLGLLLTAGAAFVEEISASVGKWEAARGRENIYALGFLNYFWLALFFLIFVFLIPKDFFAPGFPSGFVFTVASLPTFLPRVGLEILQALATSYAVVVADRSTFGFLHILTIPLLLVVDFALSYSIGLPQLAGMSLIIASLIFVFINHGIRRKGAWIVLFSSVNAVATISLFKYDITYFNSVEAEQTIVCLVLVVFFFCMSLARTEQNPIKLLAHPVFFMQSFLMGAGGSVMSFAYYYGAASVISAAKRALNILFDMLSGHIYFREKKLWIKVVSFVMIAIGLALLTQ